MKLFNKELLSKLYLSQDLNFSQIANRLDSDGKTVKNHIELNGIPLKEYDGARHKALAFNSTEQEVLDGALLGDGGLADCIARGTSRFTYLSKSRQHVEFVLSKLQSLVKTTVPKYNQSVDKRTGQIRHQHYFCSLSNQTFLALRKKWYPKGGKIIPSDINLTSLVCLIWYIGDGSLRHDKYAYYIKLSTHCFQKDQLEKLILPQLSRFNARLASAGRPNQFFVYIPRCRIKNFLEYIGPCPFEDYAYKWDYVHYHDGNEPRNHRGDKQAILKALGEGIDSKTMKVRFGLTNFTLCYYRKLARKLPLKPLTSK